MPAGNPAAGVRAVKVDRNSWAFIAGPLRALADLIYVRKEVRWEPKGLRFLTESMRLEEEDLRGIPMNEFEEVIESMQNNRVRRYLTHFKDEIGR